jgi:hypothetical protein
LESWLKDEPSNFVWPGGFKKTLKNIALVIASLENVGRERRPMEMEDEEEDRDRRRKKHRKARN